MITSQLSLYEKLIPNSLLVPGFQTVPEYPYSSVRVKSIVGGRMKSMKGEASSKERIKVISKETGVSILLLPDTGKPDHLIRSD